MRCFPELFGTPESSEKIRFWKCVKCHVFEILELNKSEENDSMQFKMNDQNCQILGVDLPVFDFASIHE